MTTQSPKPATRERRVRTAADLLADPPPDTPELLGPALITEGGISVFAGPTKIGKTNLCLHVAWGLTEGKALFGRLEVHRPCRVFMFELELSEKTMHVRLDVLRDTLGWSAQALERFSIFCGRAFLLDRRDGATQMIKLIESQPVRPDVVILDSFNAAVAGDPDRTVDARNAIHALRAVQEATGITWLLTSEIRKAPAGVRLRFDIDDLKGNNELAYDADAMLLLQPVNGDRNRLRLRFAAMRNLADEAPENLQLMRRGLTFELTEGPGDDVEEKVAEILAEHIRGGGDQSWRACVAIVRDSGLKVRDQLIGRVRGQLLKEGQGRLMEEGGT